MSLGILTQLSLTAPQRLQVTRCHGVISGFLFAVMNDCSSAAAQLNRMSQASVHVTFADTNSVASESFGSSWGGKRDYGTLEEGTEQGAQREPPSGRKPQWKRGVSFFGNKRSLSIDFGGFAFSRSQLDMIWYSLYCFVYLSIAVGAFSFVFESWSIVDSVYFAISTFTTTGFGDKVRECVLYMDSDGVATGTTTFDTLFFLRLIHLQVPSTTSGRLFTTVFALYGIIMLGIFVGIVGYAVGKAQYKEIKKLKAGSRKSVLMSMFPRHVESLKLLPGETAASRAAVLSEGTASILSDVQEVSTKAFPLLLAVVVLACVLGEIEGWPITSSLYFCVIASTTTGYGDYVPTTNWTKLYCILFVPFAVAVFANTLGRIAGIYIRRKNRMAERKFMRRSITLCDLRAMDANDDGMVSMEEFLTFMLVALQKVDRELLEELRAVFISLDRNGNGMLEKDDLIAHSKMGSREWDLSEEEAEAEEEENNDHDEEKALAGSSSPV